MKSRYGIYRVVAYRILTPEDAYVVVNTLFDCSYQIDATDFEISCQPVHVSGVRGIMVQNKSDHTAVYLFI